jgi:hypothetical protein
MERENVLFEVTGSGVADAMLPVSVNVAPVAAVTSSESAASGGMSLASEAASHETVPVAPTAGALHDQPAGDVSERNARPGGTTRLQRGAVDMLGPAFEARTWNTGLLPLFTSVRPLIAKATSACGGAAVTDTVDELLLGIGS